MVLRFDYERAASTVVALLALLLVVGLALERLGVGSARRSVRWGVGAVLLLAAAATLLVVLLPWFENLDRDQDRDDA